MVYCMHTTPENTEALIRPGGVGHDSCDIIRPIICRLNQSIPEISVGIADLHVVVI